MPAPLATPPPAAAAPAPFPMFPPNTDIVLPAPGGKLSLNAQHPPVKATILASFRHVYRFYLFTNPFPLSAVKARLSMRWITSGAEDANQPQVLRRARAQPVQYTRVLGSLVRCFLSYHYILLIYFQGRRPRVAPSFAFQDRS